MHLLFCSFLLINNNNNYSKLTISLLITRPYDETTKVSIVSMSSSIKKINFVHYDPEMHWCKTCQEFPKTAKDYLTHLHSKEHQEMQKTVESPWHEKPMNDVSRSAASLF